MSYKKPLFNIQINSVGCRGQVTLNDVPIFENFQGTPTNVDVPVSHFVVSGDNVLGMDMAPLGRDFAEHTMCKAIFQIRENGIPKNQATQLGSIELNGPGDPSRMILPDSLPILTPAADFAPATSQFIERMQALHIERKFKLKIKRPKWRWQEGEEIEATQATLDALRSEYLNFWDLLNTRDLTTIQQTENEKISELAHAFHLDIVEATEELSFTPSLMDPDWDLQPLDIENTGLELAANGRLVRLLKRNGKSPLVLLENEGDLQESFSIWWRKEGKTWKMTR